MGVKYGFYSDEHLYIFYKAKLSLRFITSGLIVPRVAETDPEVIMDRIMKTLKDLQVDENTFKIEVFNERNLDLRDNIKRYQNDAKII